MADIVLTPVPPCARAVLRLRETYAVSGIALPRTINTAVIEGEHAALKLGPDEWLLLGPADHRFAPIPGLHSLVDVSHRQVGFALTGNDAVTVLAAACPLDLADAAFPVGACTRTVLGRTEILLWRTKPLHYRIECGRSFAPYIRLLLDQAQRDWAA